MSTDASKASILYSALWKLNPDTDLAELRDQLSASTAPIPCPGQLLPRDTSLDACDIADGDIVVLELWENGAATRFIPPTLPKSLKCCFCNKKLSSGYESCACAQNCYCSTIVCGKTDHITTVQTQKHPS